MADGAQVFDASGTLMWDSTTAVSGVVGDFRKYAAGASGETVNYTQWAGFSAMLLVCGPGGEFVSLDTSGSYPVVTVTSPTVDLVFALMVY